jgi:hypothetical protein
VDSEPRGVANGGPTIIGRTRLSPSRSEDAHVVVAVAAGVGEGQTELMTSPEGDRFGSWGLDWPSGTSQDRPGGSAGGSGTLEGARGGARCCPRCEVSWVGPDSRCWVCGRLTGTMSGATYDSG